MASPTECPECGCTNLEFEAGHPDSFWEPGQPDCWYCPKCDWYQATDFYDRLEDRADDDRDARRER